MVGRTGRGNVVVDLCSDGVRPRQYRGKGDAGAGNLSAGKVRMDERRGDGN